MKVTKDRKWHYIPIKSLWQKQGSVKVNLMSFSELDHWINMAMIFLKLCDIVGFTCICSVDCRFPLHVVLLDVFEQNYSFNLGVQTLL